MCQCDKFFGYLGRSITIFAAVCAIILSILASSTCRYIYFEATDGIPWKGLEAPFEGAVAAHVGIFSYEISKTANGPVAPSKRVCTEYDDKFLKLIRTNTQEAIGTAQICAIVAPIMGGVGLFFGLVELFLCNFYGSYMFACLCLLAAAGIQAGTFSMVAEPSFCFDEGSSQDCTQEDGVYLSGAACIVFFLSGTLLCCLPGIHPILGICVGGDGRGGYHDDGVSVKKTTKITTTTTTRRPSSSRLPPPPPRKEEAARPRSPTQRDSRGGSIASRPKSTRTANSNSSSSRRPKSTRTSGTSSSKSNSSSNKTGRRSSPKKSSSSPKRPSTPRVDDDQDYYDDEEQQRQQNNNLDESDEAFFDSKPPPKDAVRVEMKEKTYPDGTVQLEEITYYKDGSKSVKTMNKDGSIPRLVD